jgi:hypothetical protein
LKAGGTNVPPAYFCIGASAPLAARMYLPFELRSIRCVISAAESMTPKIIQFAEARINQWILWCHKLSHGTAWKTE